MYHRESDRRQQHTVLQRKWEGAGANRIIEKVRGGSKVYKRESERRKEYNV